MIIAGLDIETTGLVDPAHRMIELCIQKWNALDMKNPELVGVRTWRFHPDRSIDPKAKAVHNISLDDLAGAPKLEEKIGEVMDTMSSVDLFVAHNGNDFDRPFMRLEVERVMPTALPFFDKRKWFDTMLEGRWATAWGKAPSLKELCWSCDVPYDPALAHDATYDVTVMMKSFFFGVRTGFFTP